MDEKVAHSEDTWTFDDSAEGAEIRAEKAHQRLEAKRQAVKAWADSPRFPAGAGPLVFEAVGRSATVGADALHVLAGLHYYASHRWSDGDGETRDILSAAYIALEHDRSSEQTLEAREAYARFHKAAFDYVATDGQGGASSTFTMFRRKDQFRAFLVDTVRRAANWDKGPEQTLEILSVELMKGFALFPALRPSGDRGSFAVIHERLVKLFDFSLIEKPLPTPREGEAEGGEAVDIVSALLIAAGVDRKAVNNFINAAGGMRKKRANEDATKPKRPRGRRQVP